jgi:DNA-binding transcriptional regulator YiaG
MTTTIARMRRDGTLVRVNPDGTEEVMPIPAPTPMTEAEIEAAAWADPDARPFTPEELAKARRVPRTKTLRRALGLTQEEFAARYRIPVGTLRDWEQGRSEPDQPARAYLHVIASDPEGVRRALEHGPDLQQNTIAQIIKREHQAVLTAPQRYGNYYDNAFGCSIFLTQFLKSIDPDRWIFGSFLSQVKKHHTLALFSTVRLHKVQAMMDLRQALEAGACAAFAIANPNHNHFVDTDNFGILDPSEKLARKRYRWLREHYAAGSKAIEDIKKQINEVDAHANLINSHNNFQIEYENWFSAPFFDNEDDYFVKISLWKLGNAAIVLLYFFWEINEGRNVIKFVDNFVPVIEKLRAQNNSLGAEVMESDRFKRAMEKEQARKAAAGIR